MPKVSYRIPSTWRAQTLIEVGQRHQDHRPPAQLAQPLPREQGVSMERIAGDSSQGAKSVHPAWGVSPCPECRVS